MAEHAKAALGGLHSARLVLVSVDFAEVEALQACGDWDAAGALLARACRQLEAAGADAVVLCTNTMHKVAPAMQAATDLPFLHIGDATAAAIRAAGLDCVGLLGTRFTMEQDFYRARLEALDAEPDVYRVRLQVPLPGTAVPPAALVQGPGACR